MSRGPEGPSTKTIGGGGRGFPTAPCPWSPAGLATSVFNAVSQTDAMRKSLMK